MNKNFSDDVKFRKVQRKNICRESGIDVADTEFVNESLPQPP